MSGLTTNKIEPYHGLVSVRVTPQDKGIITLYYHPVSFDIGLSISILCIVILILYKNKFITKKLFSCSLVACLVFFIGSLVFLRLRYTSQTNKEFYDNYKEAVMGAKFYKNGEFLKAQRHLEKASKYFPNSLALHEMLKKIYENNMTDKAVLEENYQRELTPEESISRNIKKEITHS